MFNLISIILVNLTIGNFYTYYPNRFEPMKSKTEINVTVKNDTLYVDALCYAKYGIISETLDRDDININEDFLGVIITQNKNSGFYFFLNPKNIKSDGIIIKRNTIFKEHDFTWNSQVIIYNDSLWKAEFFIPLSELNLQYKDSLVLYMNFIRNAWLSKTGSFESGSYIQIKGSNFYNLNFTKMFVFKVNKSTSITTEIEPYIAIYKNQNSSYFMAGEDINFKSKILQVGISVNPEYATVESDIEQFNIDKSLMLFYPEKRPFFTEGFELWELPFKIFYSRTLQDVNIGVKTNIMLKKLQANIFLVEEKGDSGFNISVNNIATGIRSVFKTKYFDAGGFFLQRKDTFQIKGADILFYLPKQAQLHMQYTIDKNNNTDIYFHFYRYVRPGLNIESGFNKLDSMYINTAYINSPFGSLSGWTYLTFNFTRENNIIPFYAVGIGVNYGEYLDRRLYEISASAHITLGVLNNLLVLYNILPAKKLLWDTDSIYTNINHYMLIQYEPITGHSISLESQLGPYFGGYLKYYSAEYSFRQRSINLSLGYGYNLEPGYKQERFFLKGKWNLKSNIRLRTFFQYSTVTHKNELDFLIEYLIKPETSLYFVINRNTQSIPQKSSDIKFMIKFKSYFPM